jgi:hypothetical protein
MARKKKTKRVQKGSHRMPDGTIMKDKAMKRKRQRVKKAPALNRQEPWFLGRDYSSTSFTQLHQVNKYNHAVEGLEVLRGYTGRQNEIDRRINEQKGTQTDLYARVAQAKQLAEQIKKDYKKEMTDERTLNQHRYNNFVAKATAAATTAAAQPGYSAAAVAAAAAQRPQRGGQPSPRTYMKSFYDRQTHTFAAVKSRWESDAQRDAALGSQHSSPLRPERPSDRRQQLIIEAENLTQSLTGREASAESIFSREASASYLPGTPFLTPAKLDTTSVVPRTLWD